MEEETKKCKYCQSDIPKKAKICPNCHKKQGPKVWLIVLIVIVALVIIGAALGGSGDSSSSGGSASDGAASSASADQGSAVPETTAVEYTAVTASQLEDALSNNALSASETYKDQYLEITGYLNVIDSSGSYISVNAGTDDYTFISIKCDIENDDQKAVIMSMSKGSKLVVKGKCTDVGEVMGYSIDIDEIAAQ